MSIRPPTVLRRPLRGLPAGLLAACLVLVAGAAFAAPVTLSGQRFADRMDHEGVALERRGAGLLTYFLIKAYASAFYMPPGIAATDYKRDVAKCLEIAYFVGIGKEKFGPAGEEVLKRTMTAAQLRSLRSQLDRLGAAYVDVEENDRYALCYAPGKGTSLKHNGRLLATVPGADFAAAYYDIWLGPKPVDDTLRDRLLGLRR